MGNIGRPKKDDKDKKGIEYKNNEEVNIFFH